MFKNFLTFSLIAFYCLIIKAQNTTCNQSELNSSFNDINKCLNKENDLDDKNKNRSIQVSRRNNNFLRNKIISTNNLKEISKTKFSLNDLVNTKQGSIKNIPLFTSCKSKLDRNTCLTSNLVEHLNSNLSSRTKKLQDNITLKFTLNQFDAITDVDVLIYYKNENSKSQILKTITKLPKFIEGANGNKHIKLNYHNAPEKNNIKTENKTVNRINYKEGVIVEKIPQFNSCQTVSISEQQQCFKGKAVEYLNENNSRHSRMSKITNNDIDNMKFIINKNQKVTALNVHFNKNNVVFYNQIMKTLSKLPKFIKGNGLNEVIAISYQ